MIQVMSYYSNNKTNKTRESIPVGCVPPVLHQIGGSSSQRAPGQRPPPPGQRPPPPGQRPTPPGQRPTWTETTWRNMGSETQTPPWTEWRTLVKTLPFPKRMHYQYYNFHLLVFRGLQLPLDVMSVPNLFHYWGTILRKSRKLVHGRKSWVT